MRKSPRPKTPPRSADSAGPAGPAAVWFMGLSGLYVLYAFSSYSMLAARYSSVQAIIMLSGQATVAMSFLLPPAVFAAALNHFELIGDTGARSPVRAWTQVALMGLVAYLLSRYGPTVFVALAELVRGEPLEAVPTFAPQVIDVARSVLPVAIGIFTVVAGLAGAVVGLLTAALGPGAHSVLRWLACLTLMVSFFVPLVAANIFLRSGSFGLWIVWSPLAFPITLTGTAALWQWRRGAVSRLPGPGRGRADIGREAVDRVVSGVLAGNEAEASDFRASVRTEAEVEVARLAAGVRRMLTSRWTISETRVREIVEVLNDAATRKASGTSPSRNARRHLVRLSNVCVPWACLSTGLLIVGLFGGVPPSIAVAATLGLLGALAIIGLHGWIESRTGTVSA